MTVERDAERAEVARERLRDFANVELHVGDWRDVLPTRAPFGFLFFDAGRLDEAPEVVDLLEPGGLLVKDDLTPAEQSTGRADGRGRPLRRVSFRRPDAPA